MRWLGFTGFLLGCLGWRDMAQGAPPRAANLPVLHLEARGALSSEVKIPCQVRLELPAGDTNASPAPVAGAIRIHGATSQGYSKKSYALTLERPVSWLGLRELRQWVVNAAYVDRSLMRHKLSYDLFRALATPGAPRPASGSRFIEVRFNQRYGGVYLLMERVDGALLGFRPYQSNAISPACLYKAVNHGADFATANHFAYEQREPDPLVREYWKPLDELNRFISHAGEVQFLDPVVGIASRVDLGNVRDFHLLLLVTSNMDGNDKNFMIGRDVVTMETPSPRFVFVPWDYDATFGRNWDATRVGHREWQSQYLFERLLKGAEYRQQFAARWKQLRDGPFSEASLHRMIDANVRELGEAVRRNDARWPTLSGEYPDQLSFAEDVAEMKEWIVRRLRWLDQQIERRTRP